MSSARVAAPARRRWMPPSFDDWVRLLQSAPLRYRSAKRVGFCPGTSSTTPRFVVCTYCHKPTLAKAQGVYGKEILINLLLLLPGLIPGAIYYFDTSRHPRCSSCRRRVRNLPRQSVPSGLAVIAS